MLELMSSMRSASCLDPRDCVYSILDLAKDTKDHNFLPDYTKSVESVYRDVAAAFASSNSSSLYYCDVVTGIDLVKLPTWAPNWDVPLPYAITNLYGRLPWSNGFAEIDGRILKVKGMLCGGAVASCSALPNLDMDTDDLVMRTIIKGRIASDLTGREVSNW